VESAGSFDVAIWIIQILLYCGRALETDWGHCLLSVLICGLLTPDPKSNPEMR